MNIAHNLSQTFHECAFKMFGQMGVTHKHIIFTSFAKSDLTRAVTHRCIMRGGGGLFQNKNVMKTTSEVSKMVKIDKNRKDTCK